MSLPIRWRSSPAASVTCRVYSDGTLFTQENELDALMSGSAMGGADLAYLSFPTLATQKGLEWLSMIGSGYFWKNYDDDDRRT